MKKSLLMKSPILVDMDQILVDMVGTWLEKYNKKTGETVTSDQIRDYDVGKIVKDYDLLYDILGEPGFFFDPPPIPGAVKYFQKMIDDGMDIAIVTQLPRRAGSAARDKRRWFGKFFPAFDLSSVIFTHRKYLVRGALLFDDSPDHLVSWKRSNPDGITATISYGYNLHAETDWRFSPEDAWEKFYEMVKKTF
jgi:5'(3')-deoxyribonucleotidase